MPADSVGTCGTCKKTSYSVIPTGSAERIEAERGNERERTAELQLEIASKIIRDTYQRGALVLNGVDAIRFVEQLLSKGE